jgi:hypothetical protein
MKPNALTNCQSKKSYPTKEAADRTGAFLYIEKQVEVESYHCNICDSYHLTQSKKK